MAAPRLTKEQYDNLQEAGVSVPAKAPTPGEIIEDLIIKGDLAKFTPEQRVSYYRQVCHSLGLNELTKPFDYITLSGKLTLYANRTCTDQLRKINGISIAITSQKVTNDVLTVAVKARDRDGREDEDIGAVTFPDTLRGDARANQILKAVTKAKRRVTLSISGLGWFDDRDADEIPEPSEDVRTSDEVDAELAAAAEQGMLALEKKWETLTTQQRLTFRAALDRRHKPAAQQADAERENQTDIVQQCGLRCKDARFHVFLEETNSAWKLMNKGTPSERAAELVRSICGVKSRKDLATNSEAAQHWHNLEGRFQAWLHE